jgi:hypothetical protein
MAEESNDNSAGYDDPETAATSSMKLLPRLVTHETAGELGFGDDTIELSALTIGKPLPVFYIRHESLENHKRGTNVRNLLTDGEELIYPIFRKAKEVSSVTVIKKSGKWFLKSIGNANLTRDLVEVRDKLVRTSKRDESEYFVVHLPSMSKIFVGHYDGNNHLRLTHVHNNAEYGFAKHDTHTGKHVINMILPKAKLRQFALPVDR